MIHSIVSLDDIFYTDNTAKTKLCRINGGLIEVREVNGRRLIDRLYSTDPYMYLDRRYRPYSEYNG